MRMLAAGLLSLGLVVARASAEPIISRDGIAEEPGVRVETVVQGLVHPWGMTWLDDATILVTERPGAVRLIRDGRLVPDPVPGLPAIFAQGQGGLLDIAAHPDFATNRLVYFSHSIGTRAANRVAVSRAVFDGARLSEVEQVFQNADPKSATQHFGSRLLWLPDGTLLITIGDGGNPPVSFRGQEIRLQGQNPGTHFGSIVRINDDGSVPEDNPGRTIPGAAPEIWSFGHRNIQGLDRDPETGALWANEHGSHRGDELNRLVAGQNFGWPAATFSRNYGTRSLITPHTSIPGMIDPELVWMGGMAPSGLAVYRGGVFPDWNGDLLSGGLVARDIRRIDLDQGGRILGETRIPIRARVRDIDVGPDAAVYVLTDDSDGALLRLTPG